MKHENQPSGQWVSYELEEQLKQIGVPQICQTGYNVHELFELLPIPTGNSELFLRIGISRRHFTMGEPKYYCMVSKWKSFLADSAADAMAKAFIALVKSKRLNFTHLQEGGDK